MNQDSLTPETKWLELALDMAFAGHRGQCDRGGSPYILHVFEVIQGCKGNAWAMVVAALHDLVEDGAASLADLTDAGFPAVVVEAVDALSRRKGESWDDYLGRVKGNSLARRVKRADLESNLDVRRLRDVGETSLERLERYRKAWQELAS
ncbi:MAG: hypothetical protein RL318_2593 [Fibrobacterota bacterium]|jgi:(p)ppGpp synthase/HD superfamily hydrolase